MPGFFRSEGTVFFCIIDRFAVAFTEHLHVTTKRYPGEGVEGAVFFAAPFQQRTAKAKREAEDFDIEATRHLEVAPFVDGDEDADGDGETDDAPEDG